MIRCLPLEALKGAACAAVMTATAFIVSPPADAAAPALPDTDHVFILPGASPDAWAPRILDRIDPWSTTNPQVRRIDANYYSAPRHATCGVIAYPRTAGPVFGPNAPYADESIETGVNMTKEAIDPPRKPILTGRSSSQAFRWGASRPTQFSGASTPTPTARRQIG